MEEKIVSNLMLDHEAKLEKMYREQKRRPLESPINGRLQKVQKILK